MREQQLGIARIHRLAVLFAQGTIIQSQQAAYF